jgi:hypothetical protein
MTDTELAWLAGWLEGEGTFFCHIEPARGNRKAYVRLTVRAASVDKEIVDKAQTIAGGRVYGPYKYTENRQPHYQWGISGKSAAAEFMRLIRPHLGTRRRAQIDAALTKGVGHHH